MKTIVAFVLDETGSMHETASDTRGAVNSYFETLAKETPDALVSLMEFSSGGGEPQFRVVASAVEPSRVPILSQANYRPRGNTPLYDAIGKAITDTEAVKADRVVLVILTDGEENSSTEWNLQRIRKAIEQKQGEGWVIVYLGANQDAWLESSKIGVSAGNTMSFKATSVGQTASRLSNATVSFATSSAATTDSIFADAGQTVADYQQPENKEEDGEKLQDS